MFDFGERKGKKDNKGKGSKEEVERKRNDLPYLLKTALAWGQWV